MNLRNIEVTARTPILINIPGNCRSTSKTGIKTKFICQTIPTTTFTISRLKPLFLSKLGSDVSEQFLLLNLLPKNSADLFLSGEVVLLNLNYWSLRPLAVLLDTNSIVNYISNRYSLNFTKPEDNINQINLIMHFFDNLAKIMPYFSEDLLLSNFSDLLQFCFNDKKENSHLLHILIFQVLKHTKRYCDQKSHLSLELSNFYSSKGEETENSQRNFLQNFIDKTSSFIGNGDKYIAPLILFDYNRLLSDKSTYDVFIRNIKLGNCRNFIFFNKGNSNLLNSTLINVHNAYGSNHLQNRIILPKKAPFLLTDSLHYGAEILHIVNSTLDAVVIGGGVIGCSIAYYLQKGGLMVTLVERENLCSGASGANQGGLTFARFYPPFINLSEESHKIFETLEEELKYSIGLLYKIRSEFVHQAKFNYSDDCDFFFTILSGKETQIQLPRKRFDDIIKKYVYGYFNDKRK